MINFKWFGHSFWKITLDDVSIIIDPFEDIGYNVPTDLTGNIVVSSHDHFDHNNVSIINGEYTLYNEPGHYSQKGVTLDLIPVWHDENNGAERGRNLLIKISYDGKSILHCGDLGHIPGNDVIDSLKNIDVILIPVGGVYTINADKAKELCDLLQPQVIFPMHYQTEVLKFELEPLEGFSSKYNSVIKKDSCEIELTSISSESSKPVVVILNYA